MFCIICVMNIVKILPELDERLIRLLKEAEQIDIGCDNNEDAIEEYEHYDWVSNYTEMDISDFAVEKDIREDKWKINLESVKIVRENYKNNLDIIRTPKQLRCVQYKHIDNNSCYRYFKFN